MPKQMNPLQAHHAALRLQMEGVGREPAFPANPFLV